MSTLTAIRTAHTMSEIELRASARRRIDALAARHGIDSPQVHDALARWGRVLESQTVRDDTMALIDALGGAA